jgi:hypothetical protein
MSKWKDQKDKHLYIKHYTEKCRSSNTKNRELVTVPFGVFGFWVPLWCFRILSTPLMFSDSEYPFCVCGFWVNPKTTKWYWESENTNGVLRIRKHQRGTENPAFGVFGFWVPLWCFRILSTPLVSSDSRYPFGVFGFSVTPLVSAVSDVWRNQRGTQNPKTPKAYSESEN